MTIHRLETSQDYSQFPNCGAVCIDCTHVLREFGINEEDVQLIEPLRTISLGKFLVRMKRKKTCYIIKCLNRVDRTVLQQIEHFVDLHKWGHKVAPIVLTGDGSVFVVGNGHVCICHQLESSSRFPNTAPSRTRIASELCKLNSHLSFFEGDDLREYAPAAFHDDFSNSFSDIMKDEGSDTALQYVGNNYDSVLKTVEELKLETVPQYFLFNSESTYFERSYVSAITDLEGIALLPFMQSLAYTTFAFSEKIEHYLSLCSSFLESNLSLTKNHLEVFPLLGLSNILLMMMLCVRNPRSGKILTENPYLRELAQDFKALHSARKSIVSGLRA